MKEFYIILSDLQTSFLNFLSLIIPARISNKILNQKWWVWTLLPSSDLGERVYISLLSIIFDVRVCVCVNAHHIEDFRLCFALAEPQIHSVQFSQHQMGFWGFASCGYCSWVSQSFGKKLQTQFDSPLCGFLFSWIYPFNFQLPQQPQTLSFNSLSKEDHRFLSKFCLEKPPKQETLPVIFLSDVHSLPNLFQVTVQCFQRVVFFKNV